MKNALILTTIIWTLISCAGSFTNKRYIYINPEEDQEMELYFYTDSTFILKDITGCNKMGQKGKWNFSDSIKHEFWIPVILNDDIIVDKCKNMHGKTIYTYVNDLDSLKNMYREGNYFPPVIRDTAFIIKNDKILIMRGLTFYKFKGNIEKRKRKILEKKIIDKIGKRMYIETIGEGISMKRARLNLSKCQ